MARRVLHSATRRGLRTLLRSEFVQAAVMDDPKLARMAWRIATHALGYNNCISLATSGEAEFIRRIARLGAVGTAIDVGANKGSYAECLLEHGFRRVLAYEPHPGHVDSLEALRARFDHRFEWYSVACGEDQGTAELLFNPDALSHASMLHQANEISYTSNVDRISVPVDSLDRLIGTTNIGEVDLLKIDVEGLEETVLRGASETIALRRPRFVQLEFNVHQLLAGSSLLSLSRLISGYVVGQLLPGSRGLREVEPMDASANVFAYSNFVFVRERDDLVFLSEPVID